MTNYDDFAQSTSVYDYYKRLLIINEASFGKLKNISKDEIVS